MRYLLLPVMLFTVAAADAPQIQVEHPWARATPGASKTGAAYLTITDHGASDQLVGVSTPAASMAEVHQTIVDNGTTKMRPAGPLPLAADKPLVMAPNGYHIMLMGLKAPLKAGNSFPLTLSFAHAAPVTVTVAVEALGSTDMKGMDHGMSGMDHGMGGTDQAHH